MVGHQFRRLLPRRSKRATDPNGHGEDAKEPPLATARQEDPGARVTTKDQHSRKDLWQIAFDQLDDAKKASLFALENDTDASSVSASFLVEKVIRQTEEGYSRYKERGWKIKRKEKEDINLRDKAKSIVSSALGFKSLVDSVVGFDPSGHG